jgi:hypothetical protein
MIRFSFPNQEEGALNNDESWSMRSAPRSNPTEHQRPTRPRIEYTATIPLFLRIHPYAVGLVSRGWQGTQSAWNMGIDLFASSHLPTQTIQRISILLLGFHLLSQNYPSTIMDGMKPLPTVWHLSAVVVFSFFLALLTSCPREAVILVNFLVIFVVNCILPLSIPICTGMFLLELLSWEGVLQILALVWLAGFICSYLVHLVLYRCL